MAFNVDKCMAIHMGKHNRRASIKLNCKSLRSSKRSFSACRLAEWVAFLHAVVIATVIMCRVRNPACTARERPRVVGSGAI